jgi:hypothetical protein
MCSLSAHANNQFRVQGQEDARCDILNVSNIACQQLDGTPLSDYTTTTWLANNAVALHANSTAGGSPIVTEGNIGSLSLSLGASATVDGHPIASYVGLASNQVDLHSNSTLATSPILSVATAASRGDIDFNSDTRIGGELIASRPYVDNAIQGIDWKQEVVVRVDCTDSAITVSNPGTDSFDGVTLVVNDRLLIVNNGVNSGIYVFKGSSTAMVRADDCSVASEFHGASVFVKRGSHAASAWTCHSFTTTSSTTPLTDFDLPFVLGTHIPLFSQFAGATLFNAGHGIVRNGQILSVDQAVDYTWTGHHTFGGAWEQSLVNTAGDPRTSSPTWNSARFSGFTGTITDTNTSHTGIQFAAFNHFTGGTLVSGDSSASYVATSAYFAEPTISGTVAQSMKFALVSGGKALLKSAVTMSDTLNVLGASTLHSLTVGSGPGCAIDSSGNVTLGTLGMYGDLNVQTGLFETTTNTGISTNQMLTVTKGIVASGTDFSVSTTGGNVECGTLTGSDISGTTGSFSSTLGVTDVITTNAGLQVIVSSNSVFSVSNVGEVVAASTGDFGGDLTVGDNFSVTATTGALSAANSLFQVAASGVITHCPSATFSNSLTVNNSSTFHVASDGDTLLHDLTFSTASNHDNAFQIDYNGAITHCAGIQVTGTVVASGNVTGASLIGTSGVISGGLKVSNISGSDYRFNVDGGNGTLTGINANLTGILQTGTPTLSVYPFVVDANGDVTAASIATESIHVNTDKFVVNSDGDVTAEGTCDVTGAISGASLSVTGNVTATNGTFSGDVAANSYESTSDQRFKTEVVPILSEGERFDRLKPVTFVWNEKSQRTNAVDEQGKIQKQWGFLAQEVGEVYHDLLRGSEETNYALNYDGFFSILVAEVQALRKRTAELEAKLAAQ